MRDHEARTLEAVTELLRSSVDTMAGPWVSLNSHYEVGCATALGATLSGSRYHDCEVGAIRIELKKTKSGGMWFDLVRYSAAMLDPSLASDVVTVVLRYVVAPHPHVTHAVVVPHHELAQALNLTPVVATSLLALTKVKPGRLNAQWRLTWGELTGIAYAVITPRPN